MFTSPYHKKTTMYDNKQSLLQGPPEKDWKLIKKVDPRTEDYTYSLRQISKKEVVKPLVNNILTKAVASEPTEKICRGLHLTNFHKELHFDFNTFRGNSRNYVMSPFAEDSIPIHSSEQDKLFTHSSLLDYEPNHLVKLHHIVASIDGASTAMAGPLELSIQLNFYQKKDVVLTMYPFVTRKLTIHNNDGRLFQQFVGSIDQYLPLSHNNIFTCTPTIKIYNDHDSYEKYRLNVKVQLKTELVPTRELNLSKLSYLPPHTIDSKSTL